MWDEEHSKERLNFFGGIGFVVLIAVALAYMFVFPRSTEDRDAFVRTSAEIVTALSVAVGLWFAYSTLKLSLNSDRRADRQLELELRDRRDERYARAAEQLWNPEEGVRIAAIQSLEGLAKDHADLYHDTISLLCAFVRKRSQDINATLDLRVRDKNHPQWRVVDDISAAALVIGRRQVPEEGEAMLDLRGANFMNVHFSGLSFANADLTYAVMPNTRFWSCDLSSAFLSSAFMPWSNFFGTSLQNTQVVSAKVFGSLFSYHEERVVNPSTNLRRAMGSDPRFKLTVEQVMKEGKQPFMVEASTLLEDSMWAFADLSGATMNSPDLTGMKGLRVSQFRSMKKRADAKLPEVLDDVTWQPVDLGDDLGALIPSSQRS